MLEANVIPILPSQLYKLHLAAFAHGFEGGATHLEVFQCGLGSLPTIIFTEYGCLTGEETIQLKLVDCQTTEIYWSATGVNATAQQTLDKVRQELEGQ